MTYKSYEGVLEIDEESGELFGTVKGLRDVVTFVGTTVEEARKSFEASVDFYLERCAATGKEPDRPFSGRFVVRISPELHRRLAQIAERRKVSLNEVASRALVDYAAGPRGATTEMVGTKATTKKAIGTKAAASRRRNKLA